MKKVISILLLFIGFNVQSSIIIPTENLGKYAELSDVVGIFKVIAETSDYEDGIIYESYHIEKIDCWKCDYEPDRIKKWSYSSENGLSHKVDVEIDLEVGKTYLLFLSKTSSRFYPGLLNYAILEKIVKNNISYLNPTELSKNISKQNRSDGKEIEVLQTYILDSLRSSILNYLGTKIWNVDQSEIQINSGNGLKTPPTGCLYLGGGGSIAGWRYENSTIDSYTDDDGDDDKPDAETCIDNAISAINGSYNVFINSSGDTDYNPTCSGGSASDDYPGYADTHLSGKQSLLHIFNDPCDEIPDLSGCNGTLAIGGSYYFGSVHSFNGSDWYSGAYAYVVYNNETGACLDCSEYEIMSSHEMNHGLGQDHIDSGSYPNNNMNPDCCNPIASKDIECSDHAYLDGALPIVLSSFTANSLETNVNLEWETKQEFNCMNYELSRSTDALRWNTITTVNCKNSNSGSIYSYLDEDIQSSEYYYRLKQIDFDGTATFFDLIHVNTTNKNQAWKLKLDQNSIQLLGADNRKVFSYKAYDSSGRVIAEDDFFPLKISTKNWPTGIAFVKIESTNQLKVFTIYR